jgi:hypothetical protein
MTDQIIKTKRGVYGRLNITLPLRAKNSVLDMVNQTGMKKSEFLRQALMVGAMQIAKNYGARNPYELYAESRNDAED